MSTTPADAPRDRSTTGPAGDGDRSAAVVVEPAAFRDVFRTVPTAVAIVTALTPDGVPVGLTVGSFASVSLEPPIVSLSVVHTSTSWAVVRDLEVFGVSVLASDQAETVRTFSATKVDRMSRVGWSAGPHGLPVVAGAVAFVACRTRDLITVGDHEVVFADVLDLEVLRRDAASLVFSGGGYAVPQPL